MAKTPAYQELVRRQTEFLSQYRAAAFAEALELVPGCQEAADALGWNQGYYEIMRARVDGLIDDHAARLDGSVCRQGKVMPTGSPPSKRWSVVMSAARRQELIAASSGELAAAARTPRTAPRASA